MKELTESQIETIRFYTTNDYLLINGLLWGERPEVINEFIDLINTDGRAVMKEAEEMGFDVRWNCDKTTGEKLYETYKKRFPVIESDETRKEIIERTKTDTANLTVWNRWKNRLPCIGMSKPDSSPISRKGMSSSALDSPRAVLLRILQRTPCTARAVAP